MRIAGGYLFEDDSESGKWRNQIRDTLQIINHPRCFGLVKTTAPALSVFSTHARMTQLFWILNLRGVDAVGSTPIYPYAIAQKGVVVHDVMNV